MGMTLPHLDRIAAATEILKWKFRIAAATEILNWKFLLNGKRHHNPLRQNNGRNGYLEMEVCT